MRGVISTGDTSVSILHVDDEPDFVEMTAEYLELKDSRFEVTTAEGAEEALEVLGDKRENRDRETNGERAESRDGADTPEFDCVISDYSMPGTDGLELLEEVREEYPDLPFILFTGKGSEEVASEAISAGVTDYLQKEPGTEQYTVLANRIRNAVNMRRSEQELREKSKQLRAVLDTVSAAVFMKDAEGRYMMMNQNCRDLLGVEDDVPGIQDRDVFSDEVADELRETDRKVLEEGKTVEFEEEIPTSEGERTLLTLKSPIFDEDGEPYAVCGVSTDITERRERKTEFRRISKEYSTVFENVRDPMFLVNVEDEGEEFLFRRFNPAYEEKVGITEEEARGKTPREVFGEEDGSEIAERYRRCLEQGESISYEETLEVPAGERTYHTYLSPVEIEGEVSQIVGSARDITERKERKKELERYEFYIQNSSDAITHLSEDGTILYQSPSVERVFGYDQNEILGDNVFDYVHPDDRDEMLDEFYAVMNDPDTDTKEVEFRLRNADGDYVWVEATGSDHTETDAGGFVVNSREITERKRIEEEIRESRRRLSTLMGNLPGMAYRAKDEPNWPFEFVSQGCHELTGYTAEELEENDGLWGEDVLDPSHTDRLWEEVQEALDSHESFEVTYPIYTKEGEVRWMWEQGCGVYDNDGNVEAIEGFITDITERKEREKELERYEAIVENTSDLVTLVEEDGTILYQSPSTRRVLGYDHEDAVGNNIFEYVHIEDRGYLMEEFSQLLEDPEHEVGDAEYSFRHVDGSTVWLSSSITDRTDTELGGFLIVSRDVTERKRREEELRSLKERLDLAVEGANLGIWDRDIEAGEVTYNDQVLEILGLSPEEAESDIEFWDERIHPDDLPRLKGGLKKQFKGETERYDIEFRMRTADGDWKWIRSMGQVVERGEDGRAKRTVGAHMDIDDSKEREEELERYEKFIEKSSDVLTHVGEDGTVLYQSPAVEHVFGYEHGETVGDKVFEYAHPDDRERVVEEFYEIINSPEKELGELEFRVRAADGSYVWVEAIGTDHRETETGGFIVNMRGITERKEREKELEKYEAFIENSSDVIIHLDEDGTMLYQSPGTERIFGHEPGANLDDNIFEYIHPDDHENVFEKFSNLLGNSEKKADEVELRAEGEDGSYAWVEAAAVDQTDTEFGGVIVSLRDISDKKEREHELERYESLVENTTDLITLIDEDGKILYQSPSAEPILGYDPEDATGYNVFDFIHPDNRDYLKEVVSGLAEDPETEFDESEYRFRSADGSFVWLEGKIVDRRDTNLDGFLVVARDVTERKEREEEVRRLKERLDLAVEGANIGIWDWDIEEDEVTYNDEWAEMIGMSHEEIGSDIEFWEELMHPEDMGELEKRLMSLIKGEDEQYDAEYRVRTGDGGWKWIHTLGHIAERDEDGRAKRAVGVHMDVDERKEREKELERYESFIENSSDIITHIDEDGTVLYQSPAVERILGHEQGERTGDNGFEYMHPDDREQAVEKFGTLLNDSTKTTEDIEVRYEHADGSYVWLEITGKDQRDTEVGGVVVNSREITERKEYEDKLERSQDLLRRTEQVADTGGWEADLETEEVRWTSGMYEIFDVPEGYEPTLEQSIQSYHPEDRDVARRVIKECREEGEPFDEELRMAQGDDVLWVHVRGEPIRENGEVTGIRASVRDITEMKEREQELERSQGLLRETEYIADTGGWELNTETDELRWTKGTRRIAGVPDDYEPTVEKAVDLYHPDDRRAIQDVIDRCRDEGEPFEKELRLIPPDGEMKWVRVRGEPIAENGDVSFIRGGFRDITQEKERETELLRNNKVVRELYEITSDPGLSFEDKIEMVLESCRSRLGLPYAFVTEIDTGAETQTVEYARGAHELLQPGESCPLEQSYCRKTLKEGGLLAVQDAPNEGWEGDEAYEKFGLGSYIGAKLTVGDDLYGTLCFADTEPRGEPFTEFERTLVELMANWVSYELERKRSENRLRRQKERLDDFASVVSHDLRSPLTVLMGNLELAEETGDADFFESCRDAVERMEAIIDDLLSLARDVDDTGEIEAVDLGEIVEECWRNIETKNAKIRVEAENAIMADRGKLRQMFENILRNSVEHGGDGVTVTVSDLPDGFRLEDDGSGISEEERDKVFEPGYTTDEGGTGLGMYIVKQVAEVHDWDVEATEGEKGGAAFEVTGVEKA